MSPTRSKQGDDGEKEEGREGDKVQEEALVLSKTRRSSKEKVS